MTTERAHLTTGRHPLEQFRLSEFVAVVAAFFASFRAKPPEPEDDTAILWEDGEVEEGEPRERA